MYSERGDSENMCPIRDGQVDRYQGAKLEDASTVHMTQAITYGDDKAPSERGWGMTSCTTPWADQTHAK